MHIEFGLLQILIHVSQTSAKTEEPACLMSVDLLVYVLQGIEVASAKTVCTLHAIVFTNTIHT